MSENLPDQIKTSEIIQRQEAFIMGLFPRMSSGTIIKVRTQLHEWCLRDGQDYFFDEDRVKKAVREVLAERRVPRYIPGAEVMSIPHELRNQLAHTMGRGDIIDRMVKSPEYPPVYLSSALKAFEKENDKKPVLGSVGYGVGLLEKWLLDKGLVQKVEGVEFQKGPEARVALEKFIEEIYTQGLDPHLKAGRLPERFSDAVRTVLCNYLTQDKTGFSPLKGQTSDILARVCPMPFVVLKEFQDREEAGWSYIEQMRQAALSYREEMNFIRGDSTASDHERFNKNIISTADKSSEVLIELMFDQLGDEVDIFFFQDSLHHHPDPIACVKEAFKRLKPGGFIAVSEPFYTSDMVAVAFTLTLAFETTYYPDSFFSFQKHAVWINYIISKGAKVVHSWYSQIFPETDFSMDPFHRLHVVLEKPKNYDPSLFASMDESVEEFVERIS